MSSMVTNFETLSSGEGFEEVGELWEGDKALIFAGVLALLWKRARAAAKA